MNVSLTTISWVVALVALVIWWIPVLLVALSHRADARTKAPWVLVCVFTTWIGCIAFILGTRPTASRTEVSHG